jgi:pSer/pThr/pTyr-binding forkhead associated (FHA) protein
MLKIRFTDERREPVWVVDKSFAVGATADNNLVIADPSVSPQHARLLLINGVYALHDLGSQAGTFVNGQRITQKALQNGDAVRLGDVSLEILDPSVPGNQPGWTLIASSSWLAGQAFPIHARSPSREVRVGRSSHCDLIFPGTHLSREHALLTLSEQSVQVRDLGSANGTFINDIRIAEGTLYSGDQVRLDVYSFRIYGPGLRPTETQKAPSDEQATKLRAAVPSVKNTPEIENTARPKRWKTRPTSPGNRSETPARSSQYNRATKMLAILLGCALVALAIYLMVG